MQQFTLKSVRLIFFCYILSFAKKTFSNPNTVMLTEASTSDITSVIPGSYITISGATTIVSNFPYYILFDGNFNVTQNLSFVNCPNMVFHPQAGIEVANGKTLTISNGCVLRAACNTMWRGIRNFGGGTVNVSGSTLRDMEEGIWIQNSSLVNCTNSTFENNRQSLWFQSIPWNYAGIIRGNTFISTGTYCISPYSGQKSMYGIRVENYSRYLTVGGTQASYANTFNNLQCGIMIRVGVGVSSTSYLFTLTNNKFQNITGGNYGVPASMGGNPVTIYNDVPGTAVFAQFIGVIGNASLVVDAPTLSPSTPNFYNCTKGITATGMHTTITKTYLSNVTWGLNFSRTEHYNYNISNNTLTNTYYGITFNGNTKTANVSSNNIATSSATMQQMNYMFLNHPVGITSDYYSPTTNYNFTIFNNAITIPSSSGVGINIRNGGVVVNANTITLTSNATPSGMFSGAMPLQGIYVNNARGCKITCNQVIGNTALLSQPRTNVGGIYMHDSRDMIMDCNTLNLHKYGFQVVGNCATAANNIKGNYFTNHVNGWLLRHLGNPGTLGPQIGTPNYDNNNLFFGNVWGTGSNGWPAKILRVVNCANPPQQFDKIYTRTNINNVTNNESFPVPPNTGYLCSYFIQQIPNSGYSCQSNCPILLDPQGPFVSDIDLAEKIAHDEVLYSEYQEGGAWLAAQRLYYALYYDTAARNASEVLDSFFLAVQNSSLGALQATDELLNSVTEASFADEQAFSQWLAAAEQANDIPPGADQQSVNEELINSLYLKYMELGVDSLTTDDSAAIANLALQCPLAGGSAVYKARAMYALYVSFSYDDIVICNDAGVFKKTKGLFDEENERLAAQIAKDHFQDVLVYPNPTTGTVTIQYYFDRNQAALFEVTDMFGRTISITELDTRSSKQVINIGNNPPGIYFYNVLLNGVQKASGKLILIN